MWGAASYFPKPQTGYNSSNAPGTSIYGNKMISDTCAPSLQQTTWLVLLAYFLRDPRICGILLFVAYVFTSLIMMWIWGINVGMSLCAIVLPGAVAYVQIVSAGRQMPFVWKHWEDTVKDKVIVISDGSTTQGLAMVNEFVIWGAKAIIIGSPQSSVDKLTDFCEHLNKKSIMLSTTTSIDVVELNVCNKSSIQKFLEAISEYKRIDTFVHNVHIKQTNSPLPVFTTFDAGDQNIYQVETHMQHNLLGYWYFAREMATKMSLQEGGISNSRIVCTTSSSYALAAVQSYGERNLLTDLSDLVLGKSDVLAALSDISSTSYYYLSKFCALSACRVLQRQFADKPVSIYTADLPSTKFVDSLQDGGMAKNILTFLFSMSPSTMCHNVMFCCSAPIQWLHPSIHYCSCGSSYLIPEIENLDIQKSVMKVLDTWTALWM